MLIQENLGKTLGLDSEDKVLEVDYEQERDAGLFETDVEHNTLLKGGVCMESETNRKV